MCGIVAVCGAPAAAERLAAGVAALAHRGPDGHGVWRAADGRVALGHTRLAVVEPAHGAQPVISEDGAVVAVVNGEIYDATAVRRALASRGHRVRGRGDAELLLHLYEQHGDRVLEHLRGEIAFVLWDARRQRLLAARDRFGVKPLLWAAHAGGLVLASETRALWALGVPRRWDDESFFHAAHTQYPWPDRTLFDGVRQIEPGGMLIWDGHGALQTRRWVVTGPGGDVRAALDEAVRLRTVADAPVAVQLSGGVDSTAVAGLAARHRPDVRAFTVSFAGSGDYDELAIAHASAAAIGIPLEIVTLDGTAIADIWPRAVAHAEQLAVNGHLAGKWALSRAMRDAGYKVALTGEGADELFAGYPHLRRDAGAAASHAPSRGLMLPDGESLPTDGVRARLGFVPTWLEAKATLGRRVRTLLAPDLLARFRGADPYLALVEHVHLDEGPAVRRSAQLWMASALAQYILRTLGDGMEMAHGIEGRVPFLDPHVADAALAIAPEELVAGEIDKPVLRAAVRDVVPAAVLARPKHPFLAPPLSVIAPELVQDLLRAHARRSSLVDGRRLVALLDALPDLAPETRRAWDPALMLLLSASIVEAGR